jgi:DNA-binding transcriptional LysR family regulator
MSNPLDPTTLRLFLAVMEERSMAKAAEREHITTPAISKRIVELEAQLNVQLLERSSKGVKPTAAGRALAADARNILEALDAAHGKLSDYARGVRGEVRISSNPTSILGTLPRDLQTFASRYPLVRISLDERRSAQIVRAVTDGDVDIGLFYSDTPHPALQVVPYSTTRLVLIAPLDHPLGRRASIRFAEAADYPFVLHPENTRLGAIVLGAAEKAGFHIQGRFQILTQEGMRRLVEAGMGVAVMPEPSVVPYAKLHRLRCIRIDEDWARQQTSIGIRRAATLPMAVRVLFSHLSGAGRNPAAKRKA